jgi:rhodanese-related sulfurtransferase
VKRQSHKSWATCPVSVLIVTIAAVLWAQREIGQRESVDTFEAIRAHIQAWLSETSRDQMIISAPDLKRIVDDWDNQKDKCQIVSVRKADDYDAAGHVPKAINIYWIDIVSDESLARLESNKTLILYCYYGHGSMLSSTILSLLGYRCRSLNFGMMDWNLEALVRKPWDQDADYEVETAEKRSEESYPPPVIATPLTDAPTIIREQARKYLSGEGSPVIRASEVKAIIDDWDHNKDAYLIVDVRAKIDYDKGHVPHAVSIPWAKIVDKGSLQSLDPRRTVIVYSENGQLGLLVSTVLNLLGYKAVDMLFGMMDWNKACVDQSDQWDGVADFPVEYKNQSLEMNLGKNWNP